MVLAQLLVLGQTAPGTPVAAAGPRTVDGRLGALRKVLRGAPGVVALRAVLAGDEMVELEELLESDEGTEVAR